MQTVMLADRVITPSKVVCIGRNYVAHIEELGNDIPKEMVVFLKPNSAIGDTLHANLGDHTLHFEGEISFIVEGGKLAAVGFGLDLTKRELQSTLKTKGLPWERAKAFDKAALFSTFLPLPVNDWKRLTLELEVNGTLRQQGSIDLMMYSPDVILSEISKFMTLEDGDIIMTGTPAGVGEVCSGERFTGRILHADDILTEHNWVAE